MARVRRSIRGIVGKQQIRGRNVPPWEVAYTRSIRRQMEQLEKNLSKVINYLEDDAALIAIDAALDPIFATSQYYVPVDTGKLKKSGFKEVGTFRGRPRGIVGYAKGGDPHYATIVHEDMEMSHKPPTSAKFLERAFKEEQDEALRRAAESLKKVFD